MSSSNDEVEILSVVTSPNLTNGIVNGVMCARCGMSQSSSKMLAYHQLISCEMRTPNEVRHNRFVLNVAKLCRLDDMHVFALERQASAVAAAAAARNSPSNPPSTPSSDVAPSFVDPTAPLEARLEAIGQLTLDQLPDELLEQLMTEACIHASTTAAQPVPIGDSADLTRPGASVPGSGVPSSSSVYQLDTTPLSYEVLRMPQYQELFDRLRGEAGGCSASPLAAAAGVSIEDKQLQLQLGIGPGLMKSLQNQAEELRAESQGEYIEWHYCYQCRQHVDRNNVARHIHTPPELCGFCPFQATGPTEMHVHRRRRHQAQRRLSCPLCRTRYNTPHAYRDHIMTHRLDEDLLLPGEHDSKGCNPNRVFEWQCELCREIPVGSSMKFKKIREHATLTCRMLTIPDTTFNRCFSHIPPPNSSV